MEYDSERKSNYFGKVSFNYHADTQKKTGHMIEGWTCFGMHEAIICQVKALQSERPWECVYAVGGV